MKHDLRIVDRGSWIVVAAALLALALAPAASGLSPGLSTVRVSQADLSASPRATKLGGVTVYTARLSNRGEALGSSILACTFLGSGGVRGGGTSWCSGSYSLPQGTLLAQGILRTRSFYQLVVIGGTGIYANVVGTLVVSTVGASREQLIFSLQALA
jgi:hypothetical protein